MLLLLLLLQFCKSLKTKYLIVAAAAFPSLSIEAFPPQRRRWERERERNTHTTLYVSCDAIGRRWVFHPGIKLHPPPERARSLLSLSLLLSFSLSYATGRKESWKEKVTRLFPPLLLLPSDFTFTLSLSLSLSLSPSTQNNVITASFLFLFQMMYNTQNKERDSGRQTKLIMNIINII